MCISYTPDQIFFGLILILFFVPVMVVCIVGMAISMWQMLFPKPFVNPYDRRQ